MIIMFLPAIIKKLFATFNFFLTAQDMIVMQVKMQIVDPVSQIWRQPIKTLHDDFQSTMVQLIILCWMTQLS